MVKKKIEKKNFAKLSVTGFALTGGIMTALAVASLAIPGMWGYFPFSNVAIYDLYGAFGHSLSWPNVLLGIIYSFIDGAIGFGLFAFIYNKLTK